MNLINWRLILTILSIICWIIAIFWFVFEPGFEPLIAVFGGLASLITSFFLEGTNRVKSSTNKQQHNTPLIEIFKSIRAIFFKPPTEAELWERARRIALSKFSGMIETNPSLELTYIKTQLIDTLKDGDKEILTVLIHKGKYNVGLFQESGIAWRPTARYRVVINQEGNILQTKLEKVV